MRRALNEALHQTNLLHFVFEEEGDLSPISPYFPGVHEVVQRNVHSLIGTHLIGNDTQARLRKMLDGLQLKVLTQDRFMPCGGASNLNWERSA